MEGTDVTSAIREKYGEIARSGGKSGGCCTSGCGCSDPITSDLYSSAETASIPDEAIAVSLGCGNPTALIDLKPGQVVLDLGSGGGIDVLLSARRVGPTGHVYGLDMTDDMLARRATEPVARGCDECRIPERPDRVDSAARRSVDVIISNCVINLSTDKGAVLREAYRVLRPGGRFAVSDVVVRGSVPDAVKKSLELWVGCVAGALTETEYRTKLSEAGFTDVDVEPWRVYSIDDATEFLAASGLDREAVASAVEGRVISAFVRATKPA